MSEIIGVVKELENIDIELKRLRTVSRNLRLRKAVLESEILDFLKEKDQPGIKYKNIAIITQDKTKRTHTKKEIKLSNAQEILEKNGVENGKEVLNKILEAMKGPLVKEKKVSLKKIKS